MVTHLLQCNKWKKASINDAVAQFQYTDNKQPITARPRRLTGPGWEAAIEGHQAVHLLACKGSCNTNLLTSKQSLYNALYSWKASFRTGSPPLHCPCTGRMCTWNAKPLLMAHPYVQLHVY